MEIIKCLNLSKSYGNTIALNNINLSIKKGKIIGLLGSNGSGKSTLIKLINELLQPTSGSIRISGKAPGIDSKKGISYLPERTYLDLSMRIKEAIEYYNDFYEGFNKEKMYKMLETMNIDSSLKLSTLSKGTKEKVQLALVMSRKADVYILDEPIGGVDPAARDFILEIILKNFDENATLIIATHLIQDIEYILDEVIFLSQGNLILHEPSDDLRNKHNKSIDAIFREEFRC